MEWNEAFAIEDCEVLRKAGKTVIVDVEGDELMIPFSQIDDNSEVYEVGDTGTMLINPWLARKLGLL
jgi:hypothetical protein